MAPTTWSNPWKIAAIGLALVVVTAVVTGLVVAKWSGGEADRSASPAVTEKPVSARPDARQTVTSPPAPAVRPQPASTVPPQVAIDACNQYAASQAGLQDKTMEAVKDAAIAAVAGAAVGAAGGAIAGGGSGAGKGAAIGGILGAGAGTLYGLNENRKHDVKYREAYASCMRTRGYTGS